jgi:hypothetical protein
VSVTYKKLKSGAWGVLVEYEVVRPGQRVHVRTKAGGEKAETIDRVLWSEDGKAICSIVRNDRQGGSRGGGVCAECGKGGALVADLEDGLLKHYRCCDIPP